MNQRLTGLIAAAYTPMNEDGSLNLGQVPRMVDHLEAAGVTGVYICGSTGEGMSLTGAERRELTEAYVAAAKGRLRTIVQVGHNSLAEARELAAHSAKIGADVISATAPSYYKITTAEGLAAAAKEVAAGAPALPFYYYHIPALTGAAVDMVDFLGIAARQIPNLRGLKFTAPLVYEYQACRALDGGAFDVLWGTDEMLLSALVVGAQGAIGSTYNIAAPLYLEIIEAYRQLDLTHAAELQLRAVELIRLLVKYPFHAAVKWILTMRGIACGPCRAPMASLSATQRQKLQSELEAQGDWEWLMGQGDFRFNGVAAGKKVAPAVPQPHAPSFVTKP